MIYYTTGFFIDGFLSVIKEWMKNNFKESLKRSLKSFQEFMSYTKKLCKTQLF